MCWNDDDGPRPRRSPAFEREYRTGVLEEDTRGDRFRPVISPFSDVPSRAPFALKGCLLTPEGERDGVWVVIQDTTVIDVRDTPPPSGVLRLDTEERVILPGLIDLHGHPEYNVFAAWEPPQRYLNRTAWRESDEYDEVVKVPWRAMKAAPSLKATLTRYAEVRALVGGVTAIQGASKSYPEKEEALVRNIDLRIFGAHHARSAIDPRDLDDGEVRSIRDDIDSGAVTAFYMHVAEGQPQSVRCHNEFAAVKDRGLLTPASVVIHGTALGPAELQAIKDAGAKLVWSPQSNLRLYGMTTDVATALALEIPIGIGADWLPSGSRSTLEELEIARRAAAAQGVTLTPQQLVGMVTWDAAAIAGLGDKLGRVAAGRPADVVVLERRHADPWRNVVEADPSWVELVVVNGDLAYGRADWMQQLGEPAAFAAAEQLVAWGRPMVLDTTYRVNPSDKPAARLAELRAALIDRYPQVGPIFA